MTKATYVPSSDDRSETFFLGRRWKANVAQEISEGATLTTEESVKDTAPNGQTILVTRERRVPLLEILRGNPTFHVDGDQPKKEPILNSDNVSTSDQYKAYAVNWFKRVTDPDEFRARWEDEADLRASCGVSDDELRFLDQFIGDRLKRKRR